MEDKKKCPKNVRQVGEKDDLYRIYIEDYVGTYLEREAGKQGNLAVGALIGETSVIDGNACMFISGAIVVSHVWSDDNQLMFSEYSWDRMLKTKDRLFDGGELLGCFICADENTMPGEKAMNKLVNRYFPESGSILLCKSGDDCALFYQGLAGMVKLKGFYIYYERNEAMQKMLVGGGSKPVIAEPPKEEVVSQFREKMTEKKSAKKPMGVRLAYALCGCLALLVCAIGINSMSSWERLSDIEKLMAGFTPETELDIKSTSVATDGDGGIITVYNPTDTVSDLFETDENNTLSSEIAAISTTEAETPAPQSAEVAATDEVFSEPATEEPTSMIAAVTEDVTENILAPTEEIIETQPQPVSAIPDGYISYIVVSGDTLSSICKRLYGNSLNVKHICEINGLGDANVITAGQELFLPPWE